ncbi:MAG TPA: recombinase family protein [Thermomicrobiales bacterium]|nr:recombinase family protein [Thermomicrobiales bacterium]
MGDEARKVGAGRIAALYARAPDRTERERVAVAEQFDACRALADHLGFAVGAATMLTDEGTGASPARPGLTALLGLIAAGEVAAVITYTLDRLAKPDSQLQETLLRELRRREIPIYVARLPRGYGYAPATGALTSDPAEVAAANREDWRPPNYIVIPTHDG